MAEKTRLRDRIAPTEPAEDDAETANEAGEDIAAEHDAANAAGTEDAEEVEEEEIDTEPEATVENLRESLQWVLAKLTHPADQWISCPNHGKVPISHSCSVYPNPQMARVQHLAGGE